MQWFNFLNKDGNGKKEDQDKPVAHLMQKKFLEERKLFLWGQVDDKSSEKITTQLLYLDAEDPGKEITFYINTPGGSITAGMAMYDTMKLIKSPVRVVVTGMAASFGAILLSAPKKGSRFVFPHARVMLHQPLIMGQIVAPAVDIGIQAEEMEKQRKELNQILADATGQSLEQVERDTDRDFYMNAEEAVKYGIADKIVDAVL